MQVICCQPDIIWEDKAANHRQVAAMLEAAAPLPGVEQAGGTPAPPDPGAGTNPGVLLLPEMFATGFSMNVAKIAEDAPGLTETLLAHTARQRGIFVLGGVVRRNPEGKGLNQAVAFNPGGAEIARYTKLHPFSFGQENQHYARGQEIVLFPCGPFTIAPFICYDLRFPEVFRAAVRRGANVLAVIACWPSAREAHWRTLLRARAIENQCYVAGVNRCGADPKQAYPGASVIIDPQGQVLAEAGDQPGVIAAEIELAPLLDYRARFPALADLRPEFFSGS